MKLSIVISGVLLSAAAALAQPARPARPSSPPRAATPDIDHDGMIQQPILNPRGDIDGVVLRDGTVVRFPPHAVVVPTQLKNGISVHVSGVKGRDQTVFDARITAGSSVLVDAAGTEGELAQLSATGRIARLLTNREGLVDAAMLDDGTVLHVGPEAGRYGVAVGAQVTATGRGGSYAAGRSIDVETLEVGNGNAITIDRPRPPAP